MSKKRRPVMQDVVDLVSLDNADEREVVHGAVLGWMSAENR
jgi:hypothetical protein